MDMDLWGLAWPGLLLLLLLLQRSVSVDGAKHFAVVVFTTESTYRQRIEQSFVPARSMFPVIRSVHLSIAFKANIAHKQWAIIKYKYMHRATTKDWLRLHFQHRLAALISVLSSLEMLDNKLDFVQILPSDRSTQWCPSAMMGQIMDVFPSRRNTPRANRRFV
ncbi:uncharacterized protein LOC119555187 [Drosophila subpulchrella]|uniref:uncharacterized protein LOC119555187 n=1 Tax=Drosophila subpulchrella TaxID=1486046 RepID=UPI0018A18F19|nr:uncharacterized protein LOC119555187 [Drosophila subpulchrella]